MNILLIEDEPRVVAFIRKGLEINQHTVTVAYNGEDGSRVALQYDYDLVILDLLLPDLHGLEVCKRIKSFKKGLPVLMLTALGTVSDKVEGFRSGADDYLPKPFHFDELLARIEALHRRVHAPAPATVYRVADLEMNCYNRSVYRNGKEISLTVKEFALLEVLMANKDRVLSRAHMSETVWGIDFNRGTNLVDVYINYLRAKVDKGFSHPLIYTVVGVGYVLKEQ